MDEKLLRQIMNNLLTNAAKYSPEGSTVTFNLNCDGEYAVFTIQDQGIGIPAKDQERMYETFHRASNVGTIQGTGLGLAITKKAVEKHQGVITFESKVNQGTTFTVHLPLRVNHD
jgi:signal transduction histidine kinase